MSRRLTPLELYGEVTTASGARFKWDANQPADSRPQNFSFRTKIGEGFSDASLQLARRIDQDYPDVNLIDDVTFTGADGTVVYEGQVAANPRDLGDRHSIGVTLAGYIAHTQDLRFAMPFVDRSPSRWGDTPVERKAILLGAGISLGDFSYTADQGGLVLGFPNQALGSNTIANSWYTAPPGVKIAAVQYRGKTTSLPAGYLQQFIATDDRVATTIDATAPTLDDTVRTLTLTTPRRYLYHQTYSSGTAATPAAGASLQFSRLSVIGNHGLTLYTGETGEPSGVYASDVIKWIAANYCPLLDTSGVEDTSYVIQHLAFNERTTPYQAFLDINKYHLWHLGVWDNRRLVYKPYDLTDYQWEIRTDDQGTTFSPQGPSTDSLCNGMEVTYTNVLTGEVDTLTPDTDTDLGDSSVDNPWNQHSRERWDQISLSTPTTREQAVSLGRAALGDRNRPRTPGTITVRGYIRDRAGNLQPVWKVRAGDTIAITNFPNDTPRLIVETDYDDETKTIRLSIDKPFALLDAYLDRQANALQAAGLA